MYARLCAANYLLDKHKEARDFVALLLKSENLRHRYNAAVIVNLYVGRDPRKNHDDRVIKSLAVIGLRGIGDRQSPLISASLLDTEWPKTSEKNDLDLLEHETAEKILEQLCQSAMLAGSFTGTMVLRREEVCHGLFPGASFGAGFFEFSSQGLNDIGLFL
jgi:hypothetical protein